MTVAVQVMWTAFGMVGGGLRPDDEVNMRCESTDEPYPEAELTDGVAHIEIHCSGDTPRHAFLKVVATTESRAAEVWKHVAESAPMTLAGWWTETSGTKGP